jgi:hypothetical protein
VSQEPRLAFVRRRLRFWSGRKRRHAASKGLGDFALEAVAADRPAAIGALPERRYEYFVGRRLEAQPVFALPLRGRTAVRAIERVLAYQRIGCAESMRAIARPAPVANACDHARPHPD